MRSQNTVKALTFLIIIWSFQQLRAEVIVVEQRYCKLTTKDQAKMGYVIKGVPDVTKMSLLDA